MQAYGTSLHIPLFLHWLMKDFLATRHPNNGSRLEAESALV